VRTRVADRSADRRELSGTRHRTEKFPPRKVPVFPLACSRFTALPRSRESLRDSRPAAALVSTLDRKRDPAGSRSRRSKPKPTARRIDTRDARVIGRKKAIQRKRERERERGGEGDRGREGEDANGFFMPVKGRVCNAAHVECGIDGSENALSLAIAFRPSVRASTRVGVCVCLRVCMRACDSFAGRFRCARAHSSPGDGTRNIKTKRCRHANRELIAKRGIPLCEFTSWDNARATGSLWGINFYSRERS